MTAEVTDTHRGLAAELLNPGRVYSAHPDLVDDVAQALADAEARGAARVSLEAASYGGDQ